MQKWGKNMENPANIYLFKVSNRNTRKRCETCAKLTIKTSIRTLLFTVNVFHIFFYFIYC